VLIGHSGGGTLAMLLAARLSGVRAVVTPRPEPDVAA
jgi:pimeloyl-ACP methyl ester carboxylesterase